MGDYRLSKNFYLSEFVLSPTAIARGIDNTPSATVINNLKLLATSSLQPLREYYDRPLVVTSGYRCPLLNKVTNGAVNSQHLLGQAADFTIPGIPLLDICKWIEKNIPFDQCILEYKSWIHLSYSASGNRKKMLSCNEPGKYLSFSC